MTSWSKHSLKDIEDVINNRLNLVRKTFKYSELYLAVTDGTKYSGMDQVKFAEDSF